MSPRTAPASDLARGETALCFVSRFAFFAGPLSWLLSHDGGRQDSRRAGRIRRSAGQVVTSAALLLVAAHALLPAQVLGEGCVDYGEYLQEVGSADTPGRAGGVALAGAYAYVADGSSGLQVIDISNPTSPAIVGSADTPDDARGVALAGAYAYIANGFSGLYVIDISNPAFPAIVGSANTPGYAKGVVVTSAYAYVADGSSGLQVIDISNPASPAIVGSVNTPGPGDALGVAVVGAYAYVADGSSGLQVIDISNPASPTIVGSTYTPSYALGVALAGAYAYVAAYSGLQVIDVSNPSSPAIVGGTYTPGYDSQAVVVTDIYAYVADGSSGLQILPTQCPGGTVGQPELGVSPLVTTVGRVFPNPSRDRHHVELHLAPGQPAGTVRIYDVAGHLVWRIDLSGLTPGSHALEWDGRGLDGQLLPSSLYFLRASGNRVGFG